MYNFFEIIVPVYNSELWIEKNITSALNQKYPKESFCVRVSDANSTDKTVNVLQKFSSNPQVYLYCHTRRYYPLENTKFLVNQCKNNSICVLVDGDDWLSDDMVLDRLNNEYNQNDLWMTCGLYAHHPSGFVPITMDGFTEEEIHKNNFRRCGKWPSHLRTFKKELFEKINEKDFLDENNNFYSISGDIAYTYPMLEMAGKRFKYLKYVNYIYNQTNPISDCVIAPIEQEQIAEKIKQKKPYERIDSL